MEQYFIPSLSSGTTDAAITSAANLDYLQYVSSTGKWTNKQPFGTEANITAAGAGGNDTVVGTANHYYSVLGTMPTTAPYFIPTGLEVLNGTVVNGSFNLGVIQVNADPPTTAGYNVFAFTPITAQSGAGVVQRLNMLTANLIPAGTLVAGVMNSNSATARFGTTTVGSENNLKAFTIQAAYPNTNNTAWTAGTEEIKFKMYYKPVMGV